MRVEVDSDDVMLFKRSWPASGLPNDVSIAFEFDRNGDLVDIEATDEDGNYVDSAEFDGPALLALSQDAQEGKVGYRISPPASGRVGNPDGKWKEHQSQHTERTSNPGEWYRGWYILKVRLGEYGLGNEYGWDVLDDSSISTARVYGSFDTRDEARKWIDKQPSALRTRYRRNPTDASTRALGIQRYQQALEVLKSVAVHGDLHTVHSVNMAGGVTLTPGPEGSITIMKGRGNLVTLTPVGVFAAHGDREFLRKYSPTGKAEVA